MSEPTSIIEEKNTIEEKREKKYSNRWEKIELWELIGLAADDSIVSTLTQ